MEEEVEEENEDEDEEAVEEEEGRAAGPLPSSSIISNKSYTCWAGTSAPARRAVRVGHNPRRFGPFYRRTVRVCGMDCGNDNNDDDDDNNTNI